MLIIKFMFTRKSKSMVVVLILGRSAKILLPSNDSCIRPCMLFNAWRPNENKIENIENNLYFKRVEICTQ